MCGMCGFPKAPGHWTEAGVANSARDRLRARFRQAETLHTMLRAFGVAAHDNNQMPGILISTPTGEQIIAADLDAVWTAAERMSGRSIDPLDPRFICASPDDGQSSP